MKPLEKLRFIQEENGSINLMTGRYDEFGEPVSEARVLARATAMELHRQLSELLGISSPGPGMNPTQDNQGEQGWIQIGWGWVEGVSTDEYSYKFQGFRPDETDWFVAHKWAPMFINTLAPGASADLITVVEQAFIDHGAPHDYRLIVEIARRIAGTSATVQVQREAFLAGAKAWEFHNSGATMWPSDQKELWALACQRFPSAPPGPTGLQALPTTTKPE